MYDLNTDFLLGSRRMIIFSLLGYKDPDPASRSILLMYWDELSDQPAVDTITRSGVGVHA